MSLPIPFIDFIPKIYKDNAKDSTTALTDKVDTHLTEWLNDIIQLAWLKDPFKINVLHLDVLGNFLNAGLKATDTEAQKRNKIAIAVQGHKLRGSFNLDAKPKIDAIAGGDSSIFRATGEDDWILVGDGLTPAAFYWATLGVETAVNMIGRGDCETTPPPAINPETAVNLLDCTFLLSVTEMHSGAASYKLTKTSAPPSQIRVAFHQNYPGGMHGLVAGNTYRFSAWVFIPSTGGFDLNTIVLRLIDSVASVYEIASSSNPTAFDTWQKLTVEKTIRIGSTATIIELLASLSEGVGAAMYTDDIDMQDLDADSAYGLSLIGAGTEIEIAGNIYIDVDNSGLSTDEVQQIVDELAVDIVPAYYIVNLGYVDGSGVFIIYANGIIS